MDKIGCKMRRYAMKRFYRFVDDKKPNYDKFPYRNIKVFKEEVMNCLLNDYCFVLTKEEIVGMEDYKDIEPYKDFPNINGILRKMSKHGIKVDINKVIDVAKHAGYKYSKCEIEGGFKDFKYVWKYEDAYFKIGLLDKAFQVINDGEKADVYYKAFNAPLFIRTSIGIAAVLLMYYKESPRDNHIIVKRKSHE